MNRNQKAEYLSTAVYVCQYCSNEFRPTRLTSKFCSRSCGDVVRKRKYRQTPKGKESLARDNKKAAERKSAWSKNQPTSYHAARTNKRRERLGSTKLSSIEKMMIVNIYEDARHMSQLTGIPHEVDHIIPISKGGPHHPSNLKVIPRDENRSKGARI